MTKLHYDRQTGNILGFYPDEITYKDVPLPNINITKEQWQYCINNNSKICVDINTLEIIDKIESIEDIKSKLKRNISDKKKSVAYGGYKFTKNNEEYIFSTSKDDLSLVLSTVLAFNSNTITSINWKCNDNKFVELNKEEFLNLYMKGAAFINEQFNKEKVFIEELESQIELSNEWITEFKQRIEIW